MDKKFELHVFGGNRLWGGPEEGGGGEPGLVYHGLLGQRELANKLMQCGFALYLQTRPEPFGIAVAEAQAAGCVTIASAVGAHPEIIESGATGFLLDGDPANESVRQRAAGIIAMANADPLFAAGMSRRAQVAPLDWDTLAASWEQLWRSGKKAPTVSGPSCNQCGGKWMLLADGHHCGSCSYYSRNGIRQDRIPEPL